MDINIVIINGNDLVEFKNIEDIYVTFSKNLNMCEFKLEGSKILMSMVRSGVQRSWVTDWKEVADLDKDVRLEDTK